VSFNKNTEEDINSLEVSISPIQNLNGYSNPWPAGGGINKAKVVYKTVAASTGYSNLQDNSVTVYSSSTTAGYRYAQFILLDAVGYAGQTLTFTAKAQQVTGSSVPRIIGRLYDSNDSLVGSTIFEKTGTSITHTFTLPATIDSGVTFRVLLYCNSGSAEATETNFYDIQVEVGSTAHDFAPYENKCPISGRTGLNAYRTRFNLCQDSVHLYYFWNNAGELQTNKNGNYAAIGVKVPVVPNKNYCVYLPDNTSGGRVYVSFFDASESVIGQENYTIGSTNVFTTTDDTRFIAIGFYKSGGVSVGERICVSLSGANDGTYEPYKGNTYSADWTTQAGTVYGGTLNVVTGVLTVNRAIVDLGTLTWRTLSEHKFYATTTGVVVYKPYTPQMLCDTYKFAGVRSASPWYGDENELTCYYVGTSTVRELYINDPAYTDVTEFKAAMSGVQLCYELATPLTYQLTPQEV
jgi:hypothetical protein